VANGQAHKKPPYTTTKQPTKTGVTAFDTADAYGPSEALLGRFRALSPAVADRATVLTKITFMGAPGAGATSREMVE
jgi:aryl-alcohol dehydrogenase-like predicted oxidoreductase